MNRMQLPQGYRPEGATDLQENKKQAIAVNVAALCSFVSLI